MKHVIGFPLGRRLSTMRYALVLAALLFASSYSYACTCGSPDPICSTYWQSPVVFRGLLLAGCAISGHTVAVEADYLKTLQAVAQDIARLKSEFPQLREFSPITNVNPHGTSGPSWPVIDYKFHTHRAKIPGGWTSGVPNPDDDGIWFWIDIHEPDSRAQIDTQPMVGPALCLDEKRVQFLILEGKKTKSVDGRIWSILQNHGVAQCSQGQANGAALAVDTSAWKIYRNEKHGFEVTL